MAHRKEQPEDYSTPSIELKSGIIICKFKKKDMNKISEVLRGRY